MDNKIWGVILAGGVGSRFWPLSTPTSPKQLLPLVDDSPMLANSVERLLPIIPADQLLISTSTFLAEHIADTVARIPGADVPAQNLLLEPKPAGTAAALTWAALEIMRRGGPDAVMVCVHADWSIGNPEHFRDTLIQAVDLANYTSGLVTVGIVPSRPDPGFGYIEPGDPVDWPEARKVARFVEKPNRERAVAMVEEGYLWNSGIFVWRVADYLAEIDRLTPEVSGAVSELSIDEFFDSVTPISVDVGVLERSDRVFVLPGDFGWDDVGTWASLARVRDLDPTGNARTENTFTVEAHNNVLYADQQSTIVAYGVSDLVVVVKDGLTVITTIDKSADLKTLLESLPENIVNR